MAKLTQPVEQVSTFLACELVMVPTWEWTTSPPSVSTICLRKRLGVSGACHVVLYVTLPATDHSLISVMGSSSTTTGPRVDWLGHMTWRGRGGGRCMWEWTCLGGAVTEEEGSTHAK